MEDTEIEIYSSTKSSLIQLLNLNLPQDTYLLSCSQNPSLVWKVLVLDSLSNKILAPIIHLSDLHLNNIVLHLQLNSKREPLRSITAVYLIEPSVDNISQVIQDCRIGLYDQIQVNFLYPPDESVIRQLAEGLAEHSSIGRVLKVYEQYLDYIVLESNLFCLNGPSFLDLNSPGLSDREVERLFDNISRSLFCVMKNCKFWPIIKAGNGMSQIVAEKLANLCWENTEELSSINRPLLVILDRTVDFSIMLHHPWTYQALLSDVFENDMNKIKVQGLTKELDKSKDKFLQEQSFIDFDQVLQNIDKQFNEWKEKYDKIGENLLSAMENVEELTETKNSIDLHMLLATELVKIIKDRHLDVFNSLEENLMKNQNANLEDVLLKQSGNEEFQNDLLRLKIIAFLGKDLEFDDEFGIVKYLKPIFKQGVANKWWPKEFYGKVKKMIGNELILPVTRIVHDAMENKDELTYFDSKFRERPKYKGKFEEVMVFMVGGGCYGEFENLMQYGKKNKKNVVYGCSSLNNPSGFLEQIKRLAERG